MVDHIMVNGRKIKYMEKENTFGVMAENTSEIGKKTFKKDTESCPMLMVLSTKEIGQKAYKTAMVITTVLMVDFTKDNGRMPQDMDKANIRLQMEGDTLGVGLMISKRVMAKCGILMVGTIREIGYKGITMERES